jgi:hypothetical protein
MAAGEGRRGRGRHGAGTDPDHEASLGEAGFMRDAAGTGSTDASTKAGLRDPDDRT